ncbi:unnamed protein product [Polarella glacialis]|uniref:Ubiquitin-like domain-containing protein n=1 Tax=Polarella glacialis TaxID=89957 RepID=A0A813GAR2_POLGL|nr:unnamed protein product [Polarella glacialis]
MSTCSICLDMLRDPVVLGCDGEHMVCREHLDELFECPMCRGPVGIPQKPQKSVLRALVAMRADAHSGDMKISVRLITGKIFCVTVGADDTVSSLKDQIQGLQGILADQQRLIFQG